MDETTGTPDFTATGVTRRHLIVGGAAAAGAAGTMALLGQPTPAYAGNSPVQGRPAGPNDEYMMTITNDPSNTISGTNYDYLTYPGIDVFMYNNGYNGMFGDEHLSGITLTLHGQRVAGNGDIHLLPVPEQWDAAAPASSSPITATGGPRQYDRANNVINLPMKYVYATGPTVPTELAMKYDLRATPEPGGIRLDVILRDDLPKQLAGSAAFNLEFIPSLYKSKSYQVDSNGDGKYDTYGVFPLSPEDPMDEDWPRPDLVGNAWYVDEWNAEKGNAQPRALARGYKFALAPEDELVKITVESDGLLSIYDGRNRSQNGWFTMSSKISIGAQAGQTVATWHIKAPVQPNWVREPNIAHSQAGYGTGLSKVAVMEIDKNDVDAPSTAKLVRLNADGSYTPVFTGKLGAARPWARYNYRNFDFSSLKTPGMYAIEYNGRRTDVFPIADDAYDRAWQPALSGFLAVAMDHMQVREGYRIWHGAQHMEDARMGEPFANSPTTGNYVPWFDGQGVALNPTIPQVTKDKGLKPGSRVPGMNVGGWCDAGDFDIEIGSNINVLQNLIYTAETFNNLDGYDTLSVTWDPETGGTTEMHRPDGVPDVVQMVKHGALQIRAQIENVGIANGAVEVPTLRQYTHLGDGSTDTDGYCYDPSLGEDEIVERDGKVYSGKNDDRMIMIYRNAVGGVIPTALLGGASVGMAGAAAVLKGYDDAFAADCLATAEAIWAREGQAAIDGTNAGARGNAFNTLVQLILATEALGKTTEYANYTAKLVELLAKAPAGTTNPFSTFLPITTYYAATLVLDQIDKIKPGYRTQVTEAAVAGAGVYAFDTTTPFGFAENLTATWGPGTSKYQTAFNATMLLKNLGTATRGLELLKDAILRGVNYTLGTHPYNDTSWVTGVGVKSHQLPYNSNRADGGKIPGSIVPGYLNFRPNFPESLDNFAFLWAENEATVGSVSTWIAPARMAAELAHEAAVKSVPAASREFSNKYMMKVQETASTSTGTGMPYETLTTPGFDLFMYNQTFSGVFGDQHSAGVELVLHGERVATNGDIHLLPTPEQWDATPAPILKARSSRKETQTVSASLTLPGTKDGKKPAVDYALKATPEPGGVKLTVVLDKPLPADLAGKAGFNLEFIPDRYRTKTFQTDTNGDGRYDDFGVIPLLPFDDMELKERARTDDQAWYVREWNKDRGDYQPIPLTTGKTITLAPEDPQNRIRITSDGGDLQLLDGRNRAQNGWFVVRTLFASGSTQLVWHIKADVDKDWARQPNIGHSQAGYVPSQSKVAIIELDANHHGPETASVERLDADGTFTKVFTGGLGKAKRWLRYDYRNFDFSKVSAPGVYRINYDGVRTDVFVVAGNAYEKCWQQTLTGFIAKQMDHIAVRDAYKITHAASHMDDAIMWPLLGEPFRDEAAYDGTWFDGQNFAPTSRTNTKYHSLEHIPGLAVGGWYDAGDFDLEATRHAGVIEDLAIAYREFKPAYDTLNVQWDKTTGGMVELHRPDGTPDLLQQVKHGALNVLARIEAIGYNFKVVEVPTLRQYTHLGDGSRDTDGYIYDPALGENERNGLRAGKQDDRLAMVGIKDTNLQYTAAYALAAAASVLKGCDDALATKSLNAARQIWDTEHLILSLDGIPSTDTSAIAAAQRQMAVEWTAAIELLIATGDQKYKDAINALWPLVKVANGQYLSFGSGGWKAALVLDHMDSAFKASFKSAIAGYKVAYDASVADNPYGVPPTVGMWGGTTGVLDMGVKMYFLHKVDPHTISSEYTLRAATYILGTHPHNNTSWLSGVGTSSVQHAYGNTRADNTFVAGGIVPGYVPIMPDLPEAKDQFGMLWFESEYVIDTAAKWIVVGNAINTLTHD